MSEYYVLGWIYGKLSHALGRDYDKSGARFSNAMARPWLSFGEITAEAARARAISEQLRLEIADASAHLDPSHISSQTAQLASQSEWSLGYYSGVAGKPLPTE